MKIIHDITTIQTLTEVYHQQGHSVALVPTMGNLHAGHLALVERAQQLADQVIVSIFVNPLQFDQAADLHRYPRTLSADVQQLRAYHTSALFCPSQEILYPYGLARQSKVSVPELSELHCGASREGHFTGVATVVTKLFNIVQADIAVFGEKDYQQLLIIKKLVNDLNIPIEIHSVATMRETDGLAMSSRNQYLDANERIIAPQLYQTLCETKQAISQGNNNFAELEQQAKDRLRAQGFTADYFSICHAQTLLPATPEDKNLVILAAAWLGKARLIDNILLDL
jgi:pantoate--beta-alanine ligase